MLLEGERINDGIMWSQVVEYLRENWLIAISTPIYIILISIEVLASSWQHKRFYSLKETVINLWLNVANYGLGLSVRTLVLLILGFFFSHSWITWEHPSWLYWLVLFFGVDLCFYVEHRCEHFSRVLWAVHVTHHSSVEFNLTTGFRSSVFRPFVSFWFFIPLTLLGFQPLDILLVDAICQIYGIMVHTRYVRKMPSWFEYIFVTPGHHRVHHASNVLYLDRNMGMVLIIWDRLFGTFQEEVADVPVFYGLTKNYEHPHHPVGIIFHEWRNLFKDMLQPGLSIKQRFHYLVEAPGWRHDEHSSTARELRRREGIK